jgi:tripartite-type tricarboxylate transporter receptor subunit TctC
MKAGIGMATICALLGALPALAADDDNFYKGKQISVIVPTPPGGGYDLYARVLIAHMPRHIPGNPNMIVQTMVGGAGLQAVNYVYNQAPRDGTVISAAHSSASTGPMLSPKGAQYDVNKLIWLGSVSADAFVSYLWNPAPVKSFEELKTKEAIVGGAAIGSASIDYAVIARDLFGLKLKIVTGYQGSADVKLAMERHEIHGTFGNMWSDLKAQQPRWVPDKVVQLIGQFGLKKHPELPDVPLFVDLAKTQEEKQILELLLARQDYAKAYFGPPDIPPARVAILRRAFDETMKDPAFLADMEKSRAPVDLPMTGEEVQTVVVRVAQTPKSVVDRIQSLFDNFKGGK